MILPGEIQRIAARLKLRDTQIEKDYVISWVLNGISSSGYLKERLIFKGGTALRKIYFPDYRLSEDLDFTYIYREPDFDEIRKHFTGLIEWVKEESRIILDLQDEIIHQTGNYNFYLGYQGPLGGRVKNKKIKIDISSDEILCSKEEEKRVINEYSDLTKEYYLSTYTLAEIITEKLRSLMQRSAPRDLYDIWYLLEENGGDIEDYIYDFQKKAERKEIDYSKLVEVVLKKESVFKKQWEEQLVNQVQNVPEFDNVWRHLGRHWKKFTKSLFFI